MPSRRALLRTCATAGLAGVAGCLSGPRTTPTTTPDRDPGTGTPADDGSTPPDDDTPTASGDRVAWRHALSGAVSAPPALAGDALVVGTEDGTVAAVSVADGTRRWSRDREYGIRGSPVVAGDLALVVTGGVGLGDHQAVHALDVAGGEVRWSFAPNEWYLDVLGVSGDVAFVASHDDAIAPDGQTLYALSLADGRTRWSTEVGDNSGGLVTDESVYVPAAGVVDAFDHGGARRWRYDAGEYQFATLSVAGDTVALVTGSSPGEWTVRGLDARTGAQRWAFDDWVAYTTRAVGDRLFVGGERLARLDPASGAPQWTADRRATLYDAPVADGHLHVAGDAAAAVAMDDGTVAWSTPLDAHLAAPACLAGGHLLVHRSESREDRNRHVVALDADDGARAWTYAGEQALTEPVPGEGRAFVGEGSVLLALSV